MDKKALTQLDSSVLPGLALVCMGTKPEILAPVEQSSHGSCKLESFKSVSLPVPLANLSEQAQQATQSRLAEALVEQVLA